MLPEADEKTLAGLKFSDALPSTRLSRRWPGCLTDLETASYLLAEPVRVERWAGGSMGRRR